MCDPDPPKFPLVWMIIVIFLALTLLNYFFGAPITVWDP